jgi:hypothetical protein
MNNALTTTMGKEQNFAATKASTPRTFKVEDINGVVQNVCLPLTVTSLSCTEHEQVWFVGLSSCTSTGRPVELTSLVSNVCPWEAEITAAAYRSLLLTPEGEAQVVEYIKHVWLNDIDADEPAEEWARQ